MIRKSYFGVFTSLLIFTAASSVYAHDDKATAKAAASCEQQIEPIIKFDVRNPLGFQGLLPAGLRRMEAAQAALKELTRNYNSVFESMANILAVDLQALTTKNNVFHLGGPGGAKTGHILWTFPDAWHIQMHEWRTDGDLFGLPTKAGLENGLIVRNTKNSLVHAEVAIIDEATASTPAVFGSLLTYLNPNERFYFDEQGIRRVAETRTTFLTGNATRAQMLMALWERLITTGPALLNRTIYKTWVPNWLAEPEQERADEVQRLLTHWDSVIEIGQPKEREEAKALKKKYQTSKVDWHMLQHFAIHAFASSPELVKATREMANEYRTVLARAVFQSYEDNKEDNKKNPYVFVPSADLTERLRRVFEIAIKTSAMLDYVEMEGMDKLASLKSPIILKTSSLWRLHYILTTIGNGLNVMDFGNPFPQVRYGLIRGVNNALIEPKPKELEDALKDPVEKSEFQNMIREQGWFNETLKKFAKVDANDTTDIEVAISKHKRARGY